MIRRNEPRPGSASPGIRNRTGAATPIGRDQYHVLSEGIFAIMHRVFIHHLFHGPKPGITNTPLAVNFTEVIGPLRSRELEIEQTTVAEGGKRWK